MADEAKDDSEQGEGDDASTKEKMGVKMKTMTTQMKTNTRSKARHAWDKAGRFKEEVCTMSQISRQS